MKKKLKPGEYAFKGKAKQLRIFMLGYKFGSIFNKEVMLGFWCGWTTLAVIHLILKLIK